MAAADSFADRRFQQTVAFVTRWQARRPFRARRLQFAEAVPAAVVAGGCDCAFSSWQISSLAMILACRAGRLLNLCWEPASVGVVCFRSHTAQLEEMRAWTGRWFWRPCCGGSIPSLGWMMRTSPPSARFRSTFAIGRLDGDRIRWRTADGLLSGYRRVLRPRQNDPRRPAANSLDPYSRRNSRPSEPASAQDGPRSHRSGPISRSALSAILRCER